MGCKGRGKEKRREKERDLRVYRNQPLDDAGRKREREGEKGKKKRYVSSDSRTSSGKK